jgi:hypothetical protein
MRKHIRMEVYGGAKLLTSWLGNKGARREPGAQSSSIT